jgi:hypothetical protein
MTPPCDEVPMPFVLRALVALVSTDGWNSLAGSPDLLVYIHPWSDGTVDALAVKGETDALAERTNPAGEPVWRHEGTLTDTIDALRGVPPPDADNAPRLVLPGRATRPHLWRPRP